MAKVEAIVNSRPLIPVSFTDSGQEPLSPSHLLLLRGNPKKWFVVKENLKVDDVLVVEDTQQRSKWVLGRVTNTYPDKRGLVRTVQVKAQRNVFKRPIAELCLLQVMTLAECLT